jgi:hypothetical protein
MQNCENGAQLRAEVPVDMRCAAKAPRREYSLLVLYLQSFSCQMAPAMFRFLSFSIFARSSSETPLYV